MSRGNTRAGAKRRKIKDEIVYEQFSALKTQCENDTDWCELLDEYARGIFRKKVRLSPTGGLVFTIRGKQIELMLDDEPDTVIERFKELHRKIGVRSTAEVQTEKEKFRQKSRQGWSSVHKLADKKLFIERYIDRRALVKNLTIEEVTELRHSIFIGIMTNRITNKDIEFKGNRIVKIKVRFT